MMERNETEILEKLKKLTARCCTALNPSTDQNGTYIAPIKMHSYAELGCCITEIIKLCIVALENEAHQNSNTFQQPINVPLILEMVLQMFPLDEFELLSEIYEGIA